MVAAVLPKDLVAPLLNRGSVRTEADVQAAVRDFLLHGDLDLEDSEVVVRLEQQAGERRRIDVEVGLCVIEVKKDLRTGNVLSEAVKQLAGYVSQRTNELSQRYVGVLTDGVDWRLYNLNNTGELVEVDSFTLRNTDDADRLATWLAAILSTTDNLTPTPVEVEDRFGSKSPARALDKMSLSTIWEAHKTDPELKLKQELWAKLLKTAFGEHFTSTDALFIDHTYLVITAELIAHELLGIPIETIDPVDLVTGRRFTDSGVHGVVESDFFDWPSQVPGGDRVIRAIARRVAKFDWSGVEHDVLKHLYESVISPEERHNLGEYYTPDWLAEAAIAQVFDDPATQRVLDPACGSGTFVFHAVRAVVTALEAAGQSNADVLNHVTRHVIGMDVHPVAVTLARVTYLLALGTGRLAAERGDISIPVYLGDSIQWQLNHDTLGQDGLTVYTNDDAALLASELHFPLGAMEDPARFDQLVARLTDKATARPRGSAVPSISQMLKPYGLNERDRQALVVTFAELCRLHDSQRNHIWGYYVRNLARPMWLTRLDGRVDVLVGNPPWLAYRYMSPAMKEVYRARTTERNLWHGGRVATQQDLSAYFVVRSCELYLKDGGRFAFVMPLATLSRKAAAGFRSGLWGQANNARFFDVWDLDKVRPHIFPVPSCVVTGIYDRLFTHESPITAAERWSGKVPPAATWADVQATISRISPDPAPKGGPAPTPVRKSPYGDRFTQGATIVPRVLHMVQVTQAVGGLGLPANQTMVMSKRSRLEKPPWSRLPDRGPVPVESAFIRPVYLGASALPYRLLAPEQAVIPWADRLLSSATSELDRYPKLAVWWRGGESLWKQHQTSALSLLERVNYQRTLEVQFPIPPQRVVYTKAGRNLTAARVTDSNAVIDHKLYWAAVTGVDEAHYLCAILNSEVTRERVEPLQSRGLFGPRDFDMYVWFLPIPEFDQQVEEHLALSELGRRAEQLAEGVVVPENVGFQKARSVVRDALAGSGLTAEIDDAVRALLGDPAE